jgi:hypothetical protein
MRSPDPLSQHDVERNIVELSGELSQATSDLYSATRKAAVARHAYAYRVAHARAFLDAEGTEKARDAAATIASSDQLLDRELSGAVEDQLKIACSNLRAQLEGMRSLNTNLRSAVTHSPGVGG